MLKITILGSGTANLDPNRNAASVLIKRNNINFVYDFGRGTAIQLSKLGLKQADIQHIILSHYHPDHVSDLLPFLHAASWSQIDKRTDELTIYGQPNIHKFMSEFKQPYDDSQFSRGFQTNLIDLPVGDTVIGDELFKITDLHHSYGLSFNESGTSIAIMGDSALNDSLIRALTDVDFGIFDSGHLTDDEIIELALATNAKTLVCSHQYRTLDENNLNISASTKGYRGTIIVAEDLMAFEL